MSSQTIEIAKIIKPHGLKGAVRVYSYVENLNDYANDMFLQDMEKLSVKSCKVHKDFVWILLFNNKNSINEVEQLAGTSILTTNLHRQDGEFFENEVINFEVFEEGSDESIGKLISFEKFTHTKICIIELKSSNFTRGNVMKNKLYVNRDEVLTIESGKITICKQVSAVDSGE